MMPTAYLPPLGVNEVATYKSQNVVWFILSVARLIRMWTIDPEAEQWSMQVPASAVSMCLWKERGQPPSLTDRLSLVRLPAPR
jgi:hypothetical protein